jgi:HTH-type transcriptional regulator/antitoxin HigA
MARKITGISRELIIHPGETIGDILEERGITQAELAARTGVSPAYVCNVISGKKDISANFAFALEYALGIPKSFWINLQAYYDAELLEATAQDSITEEERTARSSLKDVVKYLRDSGKIAARETTNDSILSLRKALGISNIANLKSIVPGGVLRLSAEFKGDPYVMGAWLRLCEIAGEQRTIKVGFDAEKVNELVNDAKKVMLDPGDSVQESLAGLFENYGINFSVVRSFRGAPVHGYIAKKKDGTFQIVMTVKGEFADIFWFMLFRELGYIVKGDVTGSSDFIDFAESADNEYGLNESGGNEYGVNDSAAVAFSNSMLIDPAAYARFVGNADFGLDAIKEFAASQGVPPFIVIGRLQRDKLLDRDCYSAEKVRYKWVD